MPIDTTMTTPVDTTSVKNAQGLYTGANGASTAKKSLDNETFMTLLVAQLKYQDPSSPMDTTEMMAQTTQLASMEKLTTMTDTIAESFALQMRDNAATLLGKQVSYTQADGTVKTGVAESVSYKYSVPMVVVDGVEVTLDAVQTVTAAGSAPVVPPAPTTPTDPDDDDTTAPGTPTAPATASA